MWSASRVNVLARALVCCALVCCALACAPVIARAEPPPSLEATLRADVFYLASDALAGRDEGSAGGLAAQAYIVERLKKCGIRPLGTEYTQPIDGRPSAANILGLIPGADPALRDRYLILSAHHDHIGECGPDGEICKGADDNAAAVALVLSVGCALASAPTPPARSILIATWDAEEPPTFLTPMMGSRAFVERPPVPLAAIDLAVVLDLVGSDLWPGFPGHMLMGAEHSATLSALIDATPHDPALEVRRVGLHLAEETPLGHQAWSDYDPFRNADIPFLFLSNGQNKRYHTLADLPEHINFPKLTAEADFVLALMQRLAAHPPSPSNPFEFDLTRTDFPHDARAVLALLDAALAPTSGLIDALKLSPLVRLRLESDRASVAALAARSPTEPFTDADIKALRVAVQRVMCLCGPYGSPATCLLF